MRKLFLVSLVVLLLTGCSRGATEDRRIVAQINKYRMNVDDLRYALRNIPYDDKRLLDTEDGRREYLDRLIEKEILLQEAQRQGLDREKDFIKSIENYWEQALLKLLLERKSKEISGRVHVYDNEIEEYYKNSGETRPLPEVKSSISRIIRQKKESEAMDAWIDELKRSSYIRIDNDLAQEILSNINK